MGLQRVRHDWTTLIFTFTWIYWKVLVQSSRHYGCMFKFAADRLTGIAKSWFKNISLPTLILNMRIRCLWPEPKEAFYLSRGLNPRKAGPAMSSSHYCSSTKYSMVYRMIILLWIFLSVSLEWSTNEKKKRKKERIKHKWRPKMTLVKSSQSLDSFSSQ